MHKWIGSYNLYIAILKRFFKWYKTMREGEYEYIHEFKERIHEIMSLQKKRHQIVDSPTEPTTVKQTSLAELHRLNITLSNYFDVAPDIINGIPYQRHQKRKQLATSSFDISQLLGKPFWIWDKREHLTIAKTQTNTVALIIL